MKINRDKFFQGFREWRGAITQEQVDGLNAILGFMENDPHLKDLRFAAYMLATTLHETAYRMKPLEEYGKGRGRKYGRKIKMDGTAYEKPDRLYFGMGYVQLTWFENYLKSTKALEENYPEVIARFNAISQIPFNLLENPVQALDPEIAYCVMSHGMRTGLFTGRRLSQYFTDSIADWVNARRIINGLDKAENIAKHGREFFAILRKSSESNHTVVDLPDQIEEAEKAEELPPSQERTEAQPETPKVAEVASETATTTVSMNAPAREGSTATIAKVSIAGIAVPSAFVAAWQVVSDLIAQGYVSTAQIGEFLFGIVRENQKYILIGVGVIILHIMLKKFYKQVTFWLQMWFAADPKSNTVEVKPQ